MLPNLALPAHLCNVAASRHVTCSPRFLFAVIKPDSAKWDSEG
jgi:hypothetical protein